LQTTSAYSHFLCWSLTNISAIGNVFQLFSAIIAVWRLDIKKSK